MIPLLYVAAGGAIGAAGRHLVGVAALRLLGPAFPRGTLAVSVAGSFLMGILIETLALKMSAPSLDVALPVERKQALLAATCVGASVSLSAIALFLALATVRSLAG